MPRQLRVFDHVEDQYRVWAQVRYVRPLPPDTDNVPLSEVGVAFVGKRPPKSYEEDPAKRYEIANAVTEMGFGVDADQMLGALPSDDNREQTRHSIPVEVLLETLDANGEIAQSENTLAS